MKTDALTKILSIAVALFLTGVLLAGGPSEALGEEEVPASGSNAVEDYHLGAGDLIKVVVWKNSEVSGDFRIRPDGKFSMPLIGDILAEGNTTDGISWQVEQKLKLFIESPFVSTILLEAASNRVFILGEVANPGTYSRGGTLTALQALSLAGGFTEFANKEKMILVRGTGEEQENIPLSYSKMLRSPGEENNPVLQRGDTIVVP
jgi:polysaccharide export outer membrane protein